MSSAGLQTAEPGLAGPGGVRFGAVEPASTRGRTEIADLVVEKIAAVALAEIPAVGGAARRLLGVAVGSDGHPGQAPQASARVSGDRVAFDAAVSITYPTPVAATVDRARAHVSARVAELAGLGVSRVDVTVTSLARAAARTGRGLR